ncbi:hypothetical protein NA57DRAFT_49388 [Rhizodiscina lignyota]|uniref:Xylanolytic transcriptional activator regulatory domain-containing protein n=1 Tax=Rhizodiscina lignyota TaxID=1504668 RepID=A0A9P4LZT4_9PEZI|nr:hypothetical protein NA57DRAFT_49388 [Rhizodiscina lignyota]
MGADVVRLETLVAHDERTPTTPSEGGRRADFDILTPLSRSSEPARYLALYKSSDRVTTSDHFHQYHITSNDALPGYQRLSWFLHESLPSREDTERICKASRHTSVLAHEILTMSYASLGQNGLKTPETLLEIPKPNQHPVLISRHMLQLAGFLQHLHPDIHKEIKGLSESPRAMKERLAGLAHSLITTNDELLGSIEGLECVMLESMYQMNVGNLRRSWVACRKAMGIAQLMGLNRLDSQTRHQVLDPKTKYDPELMWFRIVFLDRHLCLMLGLPQGCLDRSMASDAMLANDTPMGCLERMHCVLASRILERNESNPSSHDLALTRTLDMELQRAARSLPSKWWLALNLGIASTDSQAVFWEIRRLFAQVLHYNLLNQLHLPYMLRSSSAERQYEYSRITCVNASREVLSRFIALRSFNRIAFSCRTIDFLALMAAMTLLLAHLDSHHSETENILAHQYLSDRAMIEQTQENMKEINRLNSDALSAQSAELLRRLLTVEVETADGCSSGTARVSVQEAGTETEIQNQDGDAVVTVHIPYFGIIKIARDRMSKEVPKPRATATANRSLQLQVVDKSSTTSTDPPKHPSGLGESGGIPDVRMMTPVTTSHCQFEAPSRMSQEGPDIYAGTQVQSGESSIPAAGPKDIATHCPPQLQNSLSDPFSQPGEYPGLIAGGEDWAFQGVDMAFFESLMRTTGNEGENDAAWTTWQR